MEIKIVEKKDNPLLKRREVKFMVVHKGEATPRQDDVREKVAALVGADSKLTIIDRLRTSAGTNVSGGFAKIYQKTDEMRVIESHKIADKQIKTEKPKEEKKAEKPKEEKPAEEKKPEKKEEKPKPEPKKEEKKAEEKKEKKE